jgi:hypothetical protein
MKVILNGNSPEINKDFFELSHSAHPFAQFVSTNGCWSPFNARRPFCGAS